MHEVKMHSDIIIHNSNSNDVCFHPIDVPLDSNNNETPEHTFGTGKRYDSGLGIMSPQSDESLKNVFSNTHLDNNIENYYSTTNFPGTSDLVDSPKKKWSSLCTSNECSANKMSLSSNGIIELQTLDTNNNMATSIVIYRNDNKEFRHINIIDYRLKRISKVRRSNTFSNDRIIRNNPSLQRDAWRSSDNLNFAQLDLSTDGLCTNLSQGSSLSEHTTHIPRDVKSQPNIALKSSSKIILQKIISMLCCRKHATPSVTSDEEITTYENSPDWKFSLVEFDDLTYLTSGAQGTIYTAFLKGVKVALKKVKDNFKKDVIQIEHLLDLDHKNIITFIGVSDEPPNYLVMEFCTKGQLFDWLHRDTVITPQDVRCWSNQICDGMVYLHTKDIIHRDLKSPNILITEGNVLKIIDFEFSRDCCENKMLNSFVGTMAWMAPEVLREEVHTKKVDIWSFGVVVWEMITREIPYFGIEHLSILYGVGNNCLSLPLCSSIPLEIKELLSSCWEQSPEKRLSFQDISKSFNYYFCEFERYPQEQFESLQLEWKHEIEIQFETMNKQKVCKAKVEEELIRRRSEELNDAKNIKNLYSEKLMRADKLIALLNKCLTAVEDERKKNNSEWKRIQKFKQSIYPSSTNNHEDKFLSLQVQKGVNNTRLNNERYHKTASPNHVAKRDRRLNRHSVLVQEKSKDKNAMVHRKHSVPISREGNYFSGTNCIRDIELNSNNNKLSNVRTKKTSLSLETVAIDPHKTSSLNNNNKLNKRSENRWKRNSSPCKNGGFSTLSSSNKISILPPVSKISTNLEDFSGKINPSFQSSCDSFTNLRELQLTNANLLQIAYFGTSASLSDINTSQENMTDSLNIGAQPSLLYHSLLEQSISECPQLERSQNIEDMNEDCREYDTGDNIVIRAMSGRSKTSVKRESSEQSLKDSLDVSLLNFQSQTAHSLIEKETIAQGLIKPYDFLAHVNADSSLEAGDEKR